MTLAFDPAGYGGLLVGIAAVLALLLNRRESRRTRRELRPNGGGSFADEVFTRLEGIETSQRKGDARTTMLHRANQRRFERLEQSHQHLAHGLEVIEADLSELAGKRHDP